MPKIDARILIAFGIILFGWSCWVLGGLTAQAGFWDVFWPRVYQGFALGFLFVPLTTVMLAAVPVHELAGATGIATLVRQLGGSLGIAILTTLLTHETAIAWNVLSSGITQTHGVSLGTLTQIVAQQSAVIGYSYLFRISAIVFFASLPLVIFMRPPRSQRMPVSVAAE